MLVKCEITQFKTHDIRRAFSTVLHYNGVPTRVISDLMGHSEIATTEKCYIRSYDENYKEVYDMMRGSINYNLKVWGIIWE